MNLRGRLAAVAGVGVLAWAAVAAAENPPPAAPPKSPTPAAPALTNAYPTDFRLSR